MRKPQSSQVIKKVSNSLTPVNSKFSSAKDRLHKPAQTVHKRAQRSKTLMRSVVKRPSGNKSENSKPKQLKTRGATLNPARMSRAMGMVKNSRVDRFGRPLSTTKTLLSNATSRTRPAIGDFVNARSASSTAVAIRPVPSMVTSVSHQRLERMLDQALINADAHKKALNGRLAGKGRLGRHFRFIPKWLSVTLVTLVVASAGTYFAWQRIPDVSMKFASARAQVSGSLPDYVPSGFKFSGPIKYQPGVISMTFKAEGERYFTLEQQASNWDSSSLEANAVPDDSKVQTSQVKGATVYNFGDHTTWVSSGCKYTLKDHAKLNADEIFKIAGSFLSNCT